MSQLPLESSALPVQQSPVNEKAAEIALRRFRSSD
jgi:hypothetical protein